MDFLKCSVFDTEFLIQAKNAVNIFDQLEIKLIPGSKDFVLGLADIKNKFIPVFDIALFFAEFTKIPCDIKEQEKLTPNLKFLHIKSYCEELIFKIIVKQEKVELNIPKLESKNQVEISCNQPGTSEKIGDQPDIAESVTEAKETEKIKNKQADSLGNTYPEFDSITEFPFFSNFENEIILDIPKYFTFLDCI